MTVEDGGLNHYLNQAYPLGEQWFAVTTPITTPPFNTPDAEKAKELLKQHGCQIEEHPNHYILTFPEGTKKKRHGLVTLSEQFMIHFPDGFQMLQHYDVARGISLLYLPK